MQVNTRFLCLMLSIFWCSVAAQEKYRILPSASQELPLCELLERQQVLYDLIGLCMSDSFKLKITDKELEQAVNCNWYAYSIGQLRVACFGNYHAQKKNSGTFDQELLVAAIKKKFDPAFFDHIHNLFFYKKNSILQQFSTVAQEKWYEFCNKYE